MQPFEIAVSDAVLDDLRRRMAYNEGTLETFP